MTYFRHCRLIDPAHVYTLCNRDDGAVLSFVSSRTSRQRHVRVTERVSKRMAAHFRRAITDIDVGMHNFPTVHGSTKTQSYSRRRGGYFTTTDRPAQDAALSVSRVLHLPRFLSRTCPRSDAIYDVVKVPSAPRQKCSCMQNTIRQNCAARHLTTPIT